MKTLIALISISILLVMTATAASKLQHVVSFKFKNTATPEEIKKVEQGFQALKEKIPQIVSLEWGTNVSKENLDKGFTHCFIVTFQNEKDRDTYIAHSEHQAFVKLARPVLEDVFVLDFLPK
jgi:Stress responsive A/B Barrel Domain